VTPWQPSFLLCKMFLAKSVWFFVTRFIASLLYRPEFSYVKASVSFDKRFCILHDQFNCQITGYLSRSNSSACKLFQPNSLTPEYPPCCPIKKLPLLHHFAQHCRPEFLTVKTKVRYCPSCYLKARYLAKMRTTSKT
jgi:hypothetical protein